MLQRIVFHIVLYLINSSTEVQSLYVNYEIYILICYDSIINENTKSMQLIKIKVSAMSQTILSCRFNLYLIIYIEILYP